MVKKFILHYVDRGEGETVLLLAGLLASTRYWSEIIEMMEGKYHVIAFDQLGFGKSPKPDQSIEYSVEDNINAYKGTLDHLNITIPIKIVGYSSSAILAIEFAAKYPHLVKQLVLVTPPIFFTAESAQSAVERSFRTYRYFMGRSKFKFLFRIFKFIFQPFLYLTAPIFITHVKPSTARDVFRHTWKSVNNTIENVIINQNIRAALEKVHIPVKILYATHDSIVDEENLLLLRSMFANIELEKLNSTHQVPQERPDRILGNL